MRELKFRAWDKDTAKYTDGVGELYVDILEVGTKTYRIEQMCPGRYTIELFTGLKDKNGKEIYEGDIVTLNGEWEEIEHGDCSIVTFENGCFRVGNGYENEAGSYLSDWRIIGNIHENPELCGEEEE